MANKDSSRITLRKWLKVGLINLGVFVLILGALEGSARVFIKDNGKLKIHPSILYNATSEELGWGAQPLVETQVEAKFEGKLIYNVKYKFDQYSRRTTDYKKTNKRKKFAIFFGGSQTFGEGVASDQNIPAVFAKNATDVVPYNYAFQGYGPQQVYEIIRSGRLPNEVKEPEGIAIYFLKGFHPSRLVGASSVLDWGKGLHPYLYLDSKNEIQRQGTFKNGRPLNWIYTLPNYSKLLRYLGVQFPLPFSNSSYNLLCRVLIDMNSMFHQQFPSSHFVVLAENHRTQRKENVISRCLEPAGITYIHFRKKILRPIILPQGREKFVHLHKIDGHYNTNGTRVIGEYLANWYKENFNVP